MPLVRRFTPPTTVEEFLAMEFRDDARYELVDGGIVAQGLPAGRTAPCKAR